MTPLLALLLAPLALGADTVLHTGQEPIDVLSKVARDTDRPLHDFRAATLPELLRGRPPVLLGEGDLEVCAKVPVSEDALDEALAEAETSMAFLEYDQALADLDAAEDRLGCLATPVDPDLAARLYFLRGLALHFAGEVDAARTAWTQAHRFVPDLPWDENFAPDPRPVFEEARADAGAEVDARLQVLPPLADETLWVDGEAVDLRDAAVRLAPGQHLVQYGDASVTTVQLHAEPNTSPTVLFPHALRAGAAGWVDDPVRQHALSTVLAATLGEGARVYVVHEGTTWTARAGDAQFSALEAIPAGPDDPVAEDAAEVPADAGTLDPALPPPDPPAEASGRTWYLALGGAGLAVASAGMATASYLRAAEITTWTASAEDQEDYAWIQRQYTGWRTSYRVFTGVAIAGAGAAAVGVAVPLARGVRLRPAGAGLRITVRR